MPEEGITGGANAAVRRAIGRYFFIPRTTTSTTTVLAVSASNVGGIADIPIGEEIGKGRTVGGRKRSHSSTGAGAVAPWTGSSSGDRWRERRGYL